MREELLQSLTPEQRGKARACRSYEELLALAKEEGVELTIDQLEAVAGGNCDTAPKTGAPYSGPRCPQCGNTNVTVSWNSRTSESTLHTCNNCGTIWEP